MKDNFSIQSDKYLQYRPPYPKAVFDFINSVVPNKEKSWDCGTGNGQIAVQLSKYYEAVYATDISQFQLENAIKNDKILYSLQPAEKTNFPDNCFDLIIVAQAIHWFDFEKFYKEVYRTAKPYAIVCAIGYGRLQVSETIDAVITHFYKNIIGSFWDKERRYIDENYETIPFPFDELKAPQFTNKLYWSMEHLIGYINTWSAVKHFVQAKGFNPTTQLRCDIEKIWGFELKKEIRFPLLLKIGRKKPVANNIYKK